MIGVAACSALPLFKRFYVPFGFSNDKYALFSPHHLTDIVNEVIMLLPIRPWWPPWRGSGDAPGGARVRAPFHERQGDARRVPPSGSHTRPNGSSPSRF